MVVASRGDQYRRRAQECLEIAPTFRNDHSRSLLLQMAQVWQRLADDLAKASAPPPTTEQTRPAAQQQQQIQPKAKR
jgi:hypothetical protein